MFSDALLDRAAALVHRAGVSGLLVATAESCTGGLVAGLLTEISGSSRIVDRGFVTYSNDAKMDMLGVPAAILAVHGAVSAETARSMAEGALQRSRAAIAVAITGIAGPSGGSAEKPVGLVHFGCAVRNGGCVLLRKDFGDLGRSGIRLAAVEAALQLIETAVAEIAARQAKH